MTPRAPPPRGSPLRLACLLLLVESRRQEPYYGRPIGRLTQYAHGIRGTVYAVDENTLYVRGFAYDGTGPDAYFWVGDTPQPSPEGTLVPYPEDYVTRDPPILSAHQNSDILLRLPAGKRLRDIKWLSVNFGDVFIPARLDPPRPRVLPEFKRLAHGLRSGNISVLDAKTFYIPNLHYDGAGPDAYFWVPNEQGSLHPLRGYQGEDIEIQLPGRLTAYDIDWLAVWCVEYRHNFGHVYIPKDLDVPPALGQTKITTSSTTSQTPYSASNNCKEILDKRLQIRWELQGDHIQITLAARLRTEQYMAFGISGAEGRPAMLNADVVVAYWDNRVNQPRVADYSITHLAQCDGDKGVCPDQRVGGSNDVNENTCIGLATLDTNAPQPWPPRVIYGVSNFTVKIGPAAGVRGYTPITGHPSWGIAWYINDQLIPELYHPFYISDSSEGGFSQKREDDRRKQRVFAGVAYDNEGYPYPTAAGRYCEWTHKTTDQAAVTDSFEEYTKTLNLNCSEGEPAVLNWTIHVVEPGTPVPFPPDRRVNAAHVLPPLASLPLLLLTAARNMLAR
ncbi:Protein Skeletor, isoforms B/C [Operophtera brumata]|uniref:Protein Skeletor, isoforms B/C n=1 Tax=Operophtera brumata TaxID=104452 RepID=A0A0L7LQ29_OPEBR|nr:Protein Skeletor, isoforms B/C [Operophtera brumata]